MTLALFQPFPDIPEPARVALFAQVQDAVSTLLTTHEPTFLAFGYSLFLSFATVLICWHGIQMMLSTEPLGERMFGFAKLLVFIAFGYALIAYYEAPLPGVGVSVSNLVTDQMHYFANVLDARAIEGVFTHLDALWGHFVQPDAWALFANLAYWVFMIAIVCTKVVSLGVITFSLIATGVCGLVGPIFVPFFIVPKLDWLFWGWFRALLQYSFVQVVAYAYLMVFEQFLFRYVTTLPAGLTEEQYMTYGIQTIVVLGTFMVGILQVPSLASSIFSGRGGESVLPTRFISF